MNDTYLYPYSSAEARDRNELSLWRESHKANIACRNAIEEAIRQNFEIRTQASSLNDCYQVLGVFCNASNCEIKRRWKELINQYHPDRAQANGADRGTIEAYTLKMAEINNAYQNIMKSRKTI